MAMEAASSNTYLLPTIVFAGLLALTVLFKVRRKFAGHHRLPPSPMGLPVIGHLHLLRAPPVHRALHDLTARHGPLIHLRLGSLPCVVVATADGAREMFKAHDTAVSDRPLTFASRHFAYESAGFAFAPYGPYWRFMKRLCMSELLTARTVSQYRPVRHAVLSAFLRAMHEAACRGGAVVMSEELMKMTSHGVTRMATSADSVATEELRKLVKQVAELVGEFNLEDYVAFCRGLDLQGIRKRVKQVHSKFDVVLEKIIRSKEEERKTNKAEEIKKVKYLLDMLLDVADDQNAEVHITRENIKGFLMDVFTAGSDTTAATIEWALAEVINHPAVSRKLREEIDRTIGKNRLADESDLPNLPYLDAVVKETLRLHPPAPMAHRQSTRDIYVGGYDIPAGTAVLVNLWSVGRDPKYWDDAGEFQPERFLGANVDAAVDVKGQHFQLIPFGSGRRGCPGVGLALQVVPVTVAALVQCFQWEVAGSGADSSKVDMDEGIGLVAARAQPLVLALKPRLDPFPLI